MTLPDLKTVALLSTSVIGAFAFLSAALLFVLSFFLEADRLTAAKDMFAPTIVQVVLPMFTTLVASSLTYIFGKVLFAAIAKRFGLN
jgi:hypothetical protein